jgi:hypothetical protein
MWLCMRCRQPWPVCVEDGKKLKTVGERVCEVCFKTRERSEGFECFEGTDQGPIAGGTTTLRAGSHVPGKEVMKNNLVWKRKGNGVIAKAKGARLRARVGCGVRWDASSFCLAWCALIVWGGQQALLGVPSHARSRRAFTGEEI